MKINSKCSAYVEPSKVLEWDLASYPKGGIVSIQVIFEETSRRCNWLLFYCWARIRTQNFRSKGMKNWDFGNLGNKYKSSRDGIKDALSEFLKLSDTSLMEEQKEVEDLYEEIDAFCSGVEYKEPEPLPEIEKPIEIVVDEPKKVEEKTEQEAVSEPAKEAVSEDKTKTDWKVIAKKFIIPTLSFLAGFASPFLPGWAKTAIDFVLKIVSGI